MLIVGSTKYKTKFQVIKGKMDALESQIKSPKEGQWQNRR